MTYFLKVKNKKIISLKRSELAQKCVRDICRFWHLPSNAAIAKIVLHDLDLLFEGKNLKILISLKRWEPAQKCSERLLKISLFANELYESS